LPTTFLFPVVPLLRVPVVPFLRVLLEPDYSAGNQNGTVIPELFCQTFCWQLKDFLLKSGPGCRLCMVFSKTFQITKTFHVAMLQCYKGFWDSASKPKLILGLAKLSKIYLIII
jgi:hypothetical protein